MIKEEYDIAASYGQKVKVQLQTGEIVIGKAALTTDNKRAKIHTSEGTVWIPFQDIDLIQRLIHLH